MIATGILSAMKDLEVSLPVVARIQGTNGSLGMKMVTINFCCWLMTAPRCRLPKPIST